LALLEIPDLAAILVVQVGPREMMHQSANCSDVETFETVSKIGTDPGKGLDWLI
jgi:hypothetical protein